MHNLHNKFLIAFAVLIFLGGVYTYLSNDLNAQAANSSSSTSSLSSSSQNSPVSSVLNGSNTIDKISQDTAFLYTLTSLNRIKIDTSIFDDASFKALNDNTVVLEPGVPGRQNPFAAISSNTPVASSAPISLVVTNPPAQITDKSAVLNGTTNNTPGVSSAYFEYGQTPTLGKVTPQAKQSLIGTFGTSITGLTPASAYFFRAVAKVNGTLHYGDIISFNTN